MMSGSLLPYLGRLATSQLEPETVGKALGQALGLLSLACPGNPSPDWPCCPLLQEAASNCRQGVQCLHLAWTKFFCLPRTGHNFSTVVSPCFPRSLAQTYKEVSFLAFIQGVRERKSLTEKAGGLPATLPILAWHISAHSWLASLPLLCERLPFLSTGGFQSHVLDSCS